MTTNLECIKYAKLKSHFQVTRLISERNFLTTTHFDIQQSPDMCTCKTYCTHDQNVTDEIASIARSSSLGESQARTKSNSAFNIIYKIQVNP